MVHSSETNLEKMASRIRSVVFSRASADENNERSTSSAGVCLDLEVRVIINGEMDGPTNFNKNKTHERRSIVTLLGWLYSRISEANALSGINTNIVAMMRKLEKFPKNIKSA